MSVELAAAARLLSLGFAPPTGETVAEAHALAEALDLPEVAAALDGEVDALAGEYEALFGGRVRFAPTETSYVTDPFRGARELADVAGFYRAFGVAATGERADHAATELEFFSYLVLKRLEAEGEEGRATCAAAEDDFLRDHLGRWFPPFCARVAAGSGSTFYSALARLGVSVFERELAARGLVVAPASPAPRSAVEADALSCG